jgi:hypothetical protein
MVALAMALRLTVLPGYMIAAQPGALTVVMCTAQGVTSQTIALDSSETTSGKSRSDHPGKTDICPFATAGVALAAIDSPVAIAGLPTVEHAPLPIGAGLIGQGLAAPPPPPTGPPFSL